MQNSVYLKAETQLPVRPRNVEGVEVTLTSSMSVKVILYQFSGTSGSNPFPVANISNHVLLFWTSAQYRLPYTKKKENERSRKNNLINGSILCTWRINFPSSSPMSGKSCINVLA